jgi:O-acetyl-ADP-ribose deacetylase (regulator of RNase III)
MNTDRAALQSCYVSTLDLIKSKSIQTIGFCAISTGIYGFPREEAAAVALGTTRRWLEDGDNAAHIDRIIFSTFSDQDTEIYEAYMSAAFGACDQSQSS